MPSNQLVFYLLQRTGGDLPTSACFAIPWLQDRLEFLEKLMGDSAARHVEDGCLES